MLSSARPKSFAKLLVDAVLRGAGVAGVVAARDDVFVDLVLELGRRLLVEVDDRRDRARNVFFEEVGDEHGFHR
jgi:hypothetical protein